MSTAPPPALESGGGGGGGGGAGAKPTLLYMYVCIQATVESNKIHYNSTN